jgi:hypothetical protein
MRQALVAVLVGAGLLVLGLLLYTGPMPFARQHAWCMCSTSGLAAPADAAEREAFLARVRSPEFILAILRRNPQYAPLIPEAEDFWRPTVSLAPRGDGKPGVAVDNYVETRLRESYQPLFYRLRKDIYAELEYLAASRWITETDPERIRLGFAVLDAAKGENPLLDLVAPVKSALAAASTDDARTILTAALAAAEKGASLEPTYCEWRKANSPAR